MKTIYKFTASWCNPCKILSKTLEGQADLGVSFLEFDIDRIPEKAQEFNIKGVPTLLDPVTGSTLVGNKSLEEIRTWINSLS